MEVVKSAKGTRVVCKVMGGKYWDCDCQAELEVDTLLVGETDTCSRHCWLFEGDTSIFSQFEVTIIKPRK